MTGKKCLSQICSERKACLVREMECARECVKPFHVSKIPSKEIVLGVLKLQRSWIAFSCSGNDEKQLVH